MDVNLNGQTYSVVRSLAGEIIVIRQVSARMWRVAAGSITQTILAGFWQAPLRLE